MLVAARKAKHIMTQLERNNNHNKSNFSHTIPLRMFERCFELGLQNCNNIGVFNQIF